MTKTLLLTLLLILGATMAHAGAGSIGVFADPAGMSCNLPDPGPQMTSYYVVHVFTTGAAAVQYSAPKPACSTALWLADENMFPVTIGTSQDGVAVGYGSCQVGTIHVQTINYMTDGLTPDCCDYPLLPWPYDGMIRATDCNHEYWIPDPTGGRGIIKAGPACNCDVPVEQTTWGNVKALYAE